MGNGESQELDDVQREIADINDEIHEVAQQIVGPHSALWHQITTECSQALEAIKNTGHWIMRGVKGSPGIMFQGASRLVRNPRDSDIKTSIMFNYCLAQLGFEARRDNSTFVTTNKNLAKEFGQIYLIFPKNGFKFTYTAHPDLVLVSSHMSACVDVVKIKKTVEWLVKLREDPKTSLQADFAQAAGPKYEHLTSYNFMHNIMSFTPEETEQFLNETGVNMDWREFVNLSKFQNTFQPKQTDLAGALRSGTEIYILGEYIALEAGKFEKAIGNLIETDL